MLRTGKGRLTNGTFVISAHVGRRRRLMLRCVDSEKGFFFLNYVSLMTYGVILCNNPAPIGFPRVMVAEIHPLATNTQRFAEEKYISEHTWVRRWV
jgi:hypothetical protein